MSFFTPNIGTPGRLLRAGGSLLLFLLTALCWFLNFPPLLTLALFLAALFTAFEALRGWCIARACGIKTKL
ncbi:MAG: hypothetical protein HC904_14935 [Blastochloris sp.]|nr:hypothetical protein [Blastochloris sp.]